MPGEDGDLPPLHQPGEALEQLVDHLVLAALADGEVDRCGWPRRWTPNSLAPATVRKTEAVSRNSLAGMQPRCRQVPPTLSISTRATDRPATAA